MDFNPLNPSTEFIYPVGVLGTQSSGDAKNRGQNPDSSNAATVSASSEHGSQNINSSQTKVDLNQENNLAILREEHKKANGKIHQEPEPIFHPPIEDEALDYDESEFKNAIKSELDNLEALLKDLYEGVNPDDVLSDQKLNEPYLAPFFKKYPKSKTDMLSIIITGLYIALDDHESAKTNIARIRNPDLIDDNKENAGYHRAYYIMKANLSIEEKSFKEARELLKLCWDIPHRFFLDGQENYYDFYATSLGRIYLKEGNFKEAEKCFKDALALRRQNSKNSRLISSSYNDLALLYIQKRNGIGSSQADDEHALQYLNKAQEYNKIFQEEIKNKKYNLLSGQVDFKRPELAKTEEAYKKLPKS